MTAEEWIREDLEGIYIGNLNTVDGDLKLPRSGGNGSVFTWISSDERFIDGSGRVGRPLPGMGNRKVWLTCRAELEGKTGERVFEATVLQEEKLLRIRELLPVRLTAPAGGEAVLPSVVIAACEGGRYTVLPVSWGEAAEAEGKQILEGIAEGTELKAKAEVTYVPAREARKAPAPQITYCPVGQIRLQKGSEYYRFQQRMNEYLLSVEEDSMLYNFRRAAGLDTRGAEPMTGWDAETSKLRGHTTGHYLSGLALAWAATGDGRFRQRIDYMVAELAACRDAFAVSGRTKPGYLGAYDEEQFDLLEQFTKYPEIWAPYYTLEKIMSGLFDIYTLEGNPEALELLKGLGDWTYARLSRLSDATRKKMWAMYIAGEFGGMIGILAKLYGLTGEPRYLEAAEFFYNDKLFYPMEQGVDTLEDMHANQHIPQITGAMELYRVTGDEKYYRIGRNFWEFVTGHHCYRIGGTGETEMIHGRDCEDAYLTDKCAESCASYNLLRLTGQLFAFAPEGRLMDYYENTLLNHLLSTAARDASGGTTYFFPLGPGMQKEYSTEENTCCHGTGMESRYRFMENLYAEDDAYLYVNYYVPSVLGDRLEVTCGDGTVTVKALKTLDRPLRLRIPGWAREGYASTGFGFMEQGYLTMYSPLAAGEEVELSFPMELRELPADGGALTCLAAGPYMLAAVDERQEFLTVQQAMKSLVRLNEIDLEHYHVYFKKQISHDKEG